MSTTNDHRKIDVKHQWPLDECDWPHLRPSSYNGVIHVTNSPYKWELGLDAIAFQPTEVKVSVRPHENGHDLVVEGSHEARTDEHGTISRSIHRICHIPDDVDTNTIAANLYPNGLLVVQANKKIIL